MLTEQKNKTAKLFQFTATTSSPWDEVQFNFWKHKVTNMVLSSIRLALNDDAKTDVNKLLFQQHHCQLASLTCAPHTFLAVPPTLF